jgi:hypothetical protein
MNPPIRAARANHLCLGPSNSLQCSLDLTLDRSLARLNLKAKKVGPIVLYLGPEPT